MLDRTERFDAVQVGWEALEVANPVLLMRFGGARARSQGVVEDDAVHDTVRMIGDMNTLLFLFLLMKIAAVFRVT